MLDGPFADHALPERVVQIAHDQLLLEKVCMNRQHVAVLLGDPFTHGGGVLKIGIVKHPAQFMFSMPEKQGRFIDQEQMIKRRGIALLNIVGERGVDLLAGQISGAMRQEIFGPLDQPAIVSADVCRVVDEDVALKQIGQ